MKIIICGAGKVGTSIAKHLVDQGNEVTVIDQSKKLISEIKEKVDLKTIVGSASYPSILESAGCKDADMIIAVTLQDEINMVACQMAHTFFKTPRKIARLRSEDFLNPIWRDLYNADNMPIDLIISPELEVAKSIERQLKTPGVYDIYPFFDEEVQLMNIAIHDDCPLIDTDLKSIHDLFQGDEDSKKNLRASIIGIMRDKKLIIPKKNQTLNHKDSIFLVTDNKHVHRAMTAFGLNEDPVKKIIIIGGGNIGFNLAKDLEEADSDISVTIIENNDERASYIADTLQETLVLKGDGLDQSILDEANVSSANMILALTNDDETNIIVAAVAKKNNCESLILVNNSEYNNLKDVLGISRVIDPRMITVSKILKHIHRGKIDSVYSIGNNQAEIIQAQALKTSKLINKSITDADLPNGIRIGLIKRDDKILVPDKETIIKENDEIVIMCLSESIHDAEELFQVRGAF